MNHQEIGVTPNTIIAPEEAARRLGITTGTLVVWRSTGRYALPFVKVGGKVRYRLSDLDGWLNSRSRMNGATA